MSCRVKWWIEMWGRDDVVESDIVESNVVDRDVVER